MVGFLQGFCPVAFSLAKCPVPERQHVALLAAVGSQYWLFYCSGLEERKKPEGLGRTTPAAHGRVTGNKIGSAVNLGVPC